MKQLRELNLNSTPITINDVSGTVALCAIAEIDDHITPQIEEKVQEKIESNIAIASREVSGMIILGKTTDELSSSVTKNYPVQLDEDHQAFVHVNWSSLPSGIDIDNITLLRNQDNVVYVNSQILSGCASKEWVNSSIATNTAHFKGTYSISSALSDINDATINDYAFIAQKIKDGMSSYSRYKYIDKISSKTDLSSWRYEYQLNNSSFTNDQWETLNSGIKASDKDKYDQYAATKQDAITDFQTSSSNWNSTYNKVVDVDFTSFLKSVPKASSSSFGGIKVDTSISSSPNKKYAIELDDNGKAFVKVPWESGSGGDVQVDDKTIKKINGVLSVGSIVKEQISDISDITDLIQEHDEAIVEYGTTILCLRNDVSKLTKYKNKFNQIYISDNPDTVGCEKRTINILSDMIIDMYTPGYLDPKESYTHKFNYPSDSGTIATEEYVTQKTSVLSNMLSVVDAVPSIEIQRAHPEVIFFVKKS